MASSPEPRWFSSRGSSSASRSGRCPGPKSSSPRGGRRSSDTSSRCAGRPRWSRACCARTPRFSNARPDPGMPAAAQSAFPPFRGRAILRSGSTSFPSWSLARPSPGRTWCWPSRHSSRKHRQRPWSQGGAPPFARRSQEREGNARSDPPLRCGPHPLPRSGAWVRRGRATPAARTLDLRYGDCKGKVALLVAMARHAGIPAYPVLVSTVRSALDKLMLPSWKYFDHMIVCLEQVGAAEGRSAWIRPRPTRLPASCLRPCTARSHSTFATTSTRRTRSRRLRWW